MSSNGSDDEGLGAFLEEPEGFRPPTPPPTVKTYERRHYGGHGDIVGPRHVEVGLVSGHPLWGHILYPAAIALAQFLELHAPRLLHNAETGERGRRKGKNVLELGAGGGLPALVAALEGAGEVVVSDFPDASLVKNLEQNVETNINSISDPSSSSQVANTRAVGFTWGSSPNDLLSSLPDPVHKFDLILLSDLVFNHSQHVALLKTCLSCLTDTDATRPPLERSAPEPTQSRVDLPPIDLTTPWVLCFFSHHRPKFLEADRAILTLAEDLGWRVDKVWEDPNAGPAFPEDEGDLKIRGTVHGYMFTRR
ncbi:hypothetical protein JCM10212_003396 [Sporobolomyces blumeae]